MSRLRSLCDAVRETGIEDMVSINEHTCSLVTSFCSRCSSDVCVVQASDLAIQDRTFLNEHPCSLVNFYCSCSNSDLFVMQVSGVAIQEMASLNEHMLSREVSLRQIMLDMHEGKTDLVMAAMQELIGKVGDCADLSIVCVKLTQCLT